MTDINNLDGGYDSIDNYASANMWQLQGQKVHFGAYFTPPWPWSFTFWAKNASIPAPKSASGEILVKFCQQTPKISC